MPAVRIAEQTPVGAVECPNCHGRAFVWQPGRDQMECARCGTAVAPPEERPVGAVVCDYLEQCELRLNCWHAFPHGLENVKECVPRLCSHHLRENGRKVRVRCVP